MNNHKLERPQISVLLGNWNKGDPAALELLIPHVEMELRRIAHRFMRRENLNHTLQTTALVNEAFVKLVDQRNTQWQNRAHFFAISANIMRRILLHHARDRVADKRGGGAEHVEYEQAGEVLTKNKSEELIGLDQALERLAEFDQVKSRIVELRFFGGLTIEETAGVLKMAPITVSIHWRFAKAWLSREMTK
jgi:RNA polymerase sigma factor (TIGR02999 family)